MAELIQPLFILAPPRSFTSVTCAMVGQHPQMMGLPETNLFARSTYGELGALYERRPRLQHGLLRAIAQLGLGAQSEANVDAAQRWLAEQDAVSTGALFADLAHWAAPRGCVDKSPIHVYRGANMQRIEAAFADARYLHLTRHPRGTCESIYALRQDTRHQMERIKRVASSERVDTEHVGFIADAELSPDTLWLKPHLEILGFLETVSPDRQFWLRGEDLLEDPPRHLRTICEWLKIDVSDEAIEAMRHPERSPFACFGPRNARFGNDPSFLETPALREYRPKPVNLTDPLSWDSSLFLSEEVRAAAHFFGYGDPVTVPVPSGE